jgi:hypothetical protein
MATLDYYIVNEEDLLTHADTSNDKAGTAKSICIVWGDSKKEKKRSC